MYLLSDVHVHSRRTARFELPLSNVRLDVQRVEQVRLWAELRIGVLELAQSLPVYVWYLLVIKRTATESMYHFG